MSPNDTSDRSVEAPTQRNLIIMKIHLQTPEEIRSQIWKELGRASLDRHHEWRTPVLASADADGLHKRQAFLPQERHPRREIPRRPPPLRSGGLWVLWGSIWAGLSACF